MSEFTEQLDMNEVEYNEEAEYYEAMARLDAERNDWWHYLNSETNYV